MKIVSLEAHKISKQYEQNYSLCGNLDLSLDTVYINKQHKKKITAREYEKAHMKLLTNQIK